ncbi:hypothetical protein [Dyadobacter sandarakinus]|uniref:Outer membrane protein beta-barrel domain-containing protein n=1 Tax=Dyadobacter sandarakinus TaxID=2747268 RepID=A0ABX7I6A6_9BACT|nr:hypothetical protein [Dyadobacter sandarakinus]QRR01072.1 hypothetical protein HWI92_09230 [Dyadobacter sandarakinus]
MKNKLLLLVFLSQVMFHSVHAQSDSTFRIFQSGMGFYAEFGLLSNNPAIRHELEKLAVKPFTSFMGSLVLARRMESQRWYSEGRIILMNGTNYTKDRDERKAYLNGIGIGTDGSPKFVNTARWNVMLPIGVDFMLYRLNIRSNGTATLGQLVGNPAAFQAVKLFTANINVHAGAGVDYKMNVLPKYNEKVYLSAKATYHQPILGRRKWKSENVTVSDLPGLKVNQIYLQIGLVFFPKPGLKKKMMMH